jgi:hypothetical protein
MPYVEPPAWFYPTRESLGGLLLRSGRPAEAEAVFRADLERTPHNPRSLFGLSEALRAQHRSDAEARREFTALWRGHASELAVGDL